MYFKHIVFFVFAVLSSLLSFAQLSHGGKPYPFSEQKAAINTIVMPEFNIQQALDESLTREVASGKKPFSFAWNYDLSLTPDNSGNWSQTSDGTRIWRIHLVSKNAKAVSVDFKQFQLQKGSSVFIYPPSKEFFLGGFNELNNNASKSLPTSLISGDEIIVELQIIPGLTDYGFLEIGSLSHAYIDIFNMDDQDELKSGSCNVDINCSEGEDWQTIKKAICKYTFKVGVSTEACTGTLINNTRFDSIPYILTANHCITNASRATSAVFYFNYEKDTCNLKVISNSFSLAGSSLLATSDSIDFSLLRLYETPPSVKKPYYAGWTLSEIPASSATCIHHPTGDVKKISLENNALTSVYQDNIPDYLLWLVNESVPQAFWRVVDWETGTTEGGSSGAPLFNQNKLLVGNLTGGQANCSNSVNDYFSKFYMGWDHYADSSKQLKHWLDPDNLGSTFIYGFNPFGLPDTAIIDTVVYGPRFTLFPNPAKKNVVFETDSLDISGGILSIYTVLGKKVAQYTIEEPKRLSFDVSFLAQGIYIVEFSKGNIRERRKLMVLNSEL